MLSCAPEEVGWRMLYEEDAMEVTCTLPADINVLNDDELLIILSFARFGALLTIKSGSKRFASLTRQALGTQLQWRAAREFNACY